MSDERIAVVTAILDQRWHNQVTSEATARAILEALDQRAMNTKWEGVREAVVRDAGGKWIPRSDLLAYLNTLPGATLTMADLNAEIAQAGYPKFYPRNYNGDPKLQAACLRVFKREQRAGTEFKAILHAIWKEVLDPAMDEDMAKQRAAQLEQQNKLVQSGQNFGPLSRVDPKSSDYYLRHDGQLFRIHRLATKDYSVFRVDNVGDEGTAAFESTFRHINLARDAIRGVDPRVAEENQRHVDAQYRERRQEARQRRRRRP